MKFPSFLKVATFPKSRWLEVNKTLVKRTFQDRAEEMFIKLFSEKLGFSYKLVYPEDEQYGTRLDDGNWTGLVGLLQRKEADVIFHRIAITNERKEVMDFSYTYGYGAMVFVTRKSERVSDPETFLKPFTFSVWITFAACLCIVPVIYNTLFQRKYSLRSLITGRLLRNLRGGVTSRNSECIMRLCWEVSMMLFRYSYVALILSFLSVPPLIGIRTIPQLATAVQEGRYQTTTMLGSFLPKTLIKTGGYSAIIGHNLAKNEGSMDWENALEETVHSKKTAVIGGDAVLIHLQEKYFISQDVFFHFLTAIGISKDFCCKKHLDAVVNNLWPSGIYHHLQKYGMLFEEYEILKQSPFNQDYESKERPLSLEDFRGVFMMLASGYFLAVIAFLIELVYSKHRNP